MTCLCKEVFCFKCGCGSCPSGSNSTHYLLPLLVALWDTRRRKCTSNPPCELWGEMAFPFPFSYGEREDDANRVVQVATRPDSPLSARPQAVNSFGGVFQPPVHEPLHCGPSHSASQYSNCDHGGDFNWIDNPGAYARFIMASTIPVQFESTRYRELHPPVHPGDG